MTSISPNTTFSPEYLVLKMKDILFFDIDRKDEEEIINKFNKFYNEYHYNLRIYQTKNGYRAFVTNQKFNIIFDQNKILKFYKMVDADERYLQASKARFNYFFVSRIGPKYLNTHDRGNAIKNFMIYLSNENESVAKYITSIGDGVILDEFQDLIKEHDHFTKSFNHNSILV